MADFSRFFHRASKDLSDGGRVWISQSEDEWPQEWKTVDYKTYPRFPRLALSDAPPEADLFATIRTRRTRRNFNRTPIPIGKLSTLLKYSCGITGEYEGFNPRRAHPSGGARFPLEIYPLMFRGDSDIASGVYHYDVKEHALEELWKREFSEGDIHSLTGYEWIQDASCMLVITALFSRTQDKYGERGYRLALLEAGHIGQNVYLTSTALGLKCCAVSGVYDERIEKVLDIDGVNESVVSVLVLG